MSTCNKCEDFGFITYPNSITPNYCTCVYGAEARLLDEEVKFKIDLDDRSDDRRSTDD